MRDRRLAFCPGGVCWPSSQTSNRLVSDRNASRRLGHATATCGKVRSRVALAEASLLLGMLLGVPTAAAQQEDQGQGPPDSARGCAHATPGPIYDPISGDRVGRDDLSCLPSGRHLGAVFDVWFNRVLNQQIAGGGIAFFDPLRLSSQVPINRSTNGWDTGTYGTLFTALTRSTRRLACHWWNRYSGS